MSFSEGALKQAHGHCTSNEREIGESEVCGCFYCEATFAPSAIERYLEGERTAFCPKCEIDSVLGSASGLPVTDPAFLKAMHTYWFESATVA